MSKQYQPYQPTKWERGIDKALGIVSPKVSLNRMVARERMNYFRYLSAQSTSARPNSSATTAGEWMRIQREKLQVMWNAIDMVDNSGLCSGILIKFPTYVCGTLSWQARTGDKDINSVYQQYIKEKTTKPGNIDITKRFTLRQMCMLDVKCIALKGDVGTNIVREDESDPDSELYLQGIEANRIGDPYHYQTSASYVRGLILNPRTGSIDAAQVFYQDKRTGQYRFEGTYKTRDDRGLPKFLFFTNPIPISFDDYRGVSLFKSAIDLDTYISSMRRYELQALMWAASQSGVYYTKSGLLPDSLPFDRNRLQDRDGNYIDTYEVRPNTVTALSEGEDVKMFNHERPSPNVIGMYENTVRDIAIGAGLTYGFTYDMTGLTGPAVRQCSAQDARAIQIWQEHLREQKLDQVVMLLLGEGIARGELPYHPNWLNWSWFFPAKPTIDVGRESDADINEVNSVLNTGAMVVADGGRGDIEDIITQRGHEVDMMIEAAQKVAKAKGLQWQEVYALMRPQTAGKGGGMQQAAGQAADAVDRGKNKDKPGATEDATNLDDEKMSSNGHRPYHFHFEFDPNQHPRDKDGKWTNKGNGDGGAATATATQKKTASDLKISNESGEDDGEGWEWHYGRDKEGGSAKARMLTSPEGDGRMAVRLLETMPEARGKGYASALLEHAISYAKEKGDTELISDPEGGTTKDAGRLWERIGADKVEMEGAKEGFVYRVKLFPELTGIDKDIVDYKPGRRSLNDPAKQAYLSEILPHTRYVPYSKTPFFTAVSAMQGVLDVSSVDGARYKQSRDEFLNKQPVVDIPLDKIVVTQPSVNKDRIAAMGKSLVGHGEEGTETAPIQVVRYDGETYILNGHHRLADTVLKGGETIKAHSLTLTDQEISVYASAAKVKPKLDDMVDKVAKDHNASALTPPLKSLARAREKVEGDYDGDWSRIKDVVRSRILTNSDQDMNDVAADLERRLGIKPKITTTKNSGYRDFKFNPVIDGHIAEIGVVTNEINGMAEKGHVFYEKAQSLERKAKKENRALTESELSELTSLNDQMRAMFGKGAGHATVYSEAH